MYKNVIPPRTWQNYVTGSVDWYMGTKIERNVHTIYDQNAPTSRLKSKKSFLKISEKLLEVPSQSRISEWKKKLTHMTGKGDGIFRKSTSWPQLVEWPIRRTLNRLRIGVGRSKENMQKWGYGDQNITCICGQGQTMSYLLVCSVGKYLPNQ